MKRPLFSAAISLIISILFICKFSPEILIRDPCSGYKENDEISIKGTIYNIEKKKNSLKIYLKNSEIEPEYSEGIKNNNIYAGKMLVTADLTEFSDSVFRLGNCVTVSGKYKPFSAARNYGNFDEKEYYNSLGIFAGIEALKIVITDHDFWKIKQWLFELRQNLVKSIYSQVNDDETAGILSAICTGDRSGLNTQTKDLYRRSGIAHILAVSGVHITFLGMGVFRLIRRKFKYYISALVSCTVMILFCIMSGGSPSAVRATVMFVIQIIAIGTGKSYDILCSLSLAAIMLLLSNPLYLKNTGFQLSFLAMFAVAAVYPELQQDYLFYLRKKKRKKKDLFLRKYSDKIINGMIMSFSITLLTIPVVSSVYYEIPVYSILINIIVIPIMSAVLGSAVISSFIGIFHIIAGRFFVGLGVYLVYLIRMICGLFNLLPFNNIVTGAPSPWRVSVYYFLIFLGIAGLRITRVRMKKKEERTENRIICKYDQTLSGNGKYHNLIRNLSAFSFYTFILFTVLFYRFPSDSLMITMIDVDQGECILIQSPSGITYMVDGGSTSVNEVAEYRIAGALKYKGISHIDYCIITHPDTDHISGIESLIREKDIFNICINNLITPCIENNENYEKLESLGSEYGITFTDLYKGVGLNDGYIVLSCLHPERNYYSENINGYSGVIELKFGRFSALLTGDIGKEEEQNLDIKHRYDLLKVAHHGSRYSSDEGFISSVSPDLAIISAGVNNIYGHPHPEVLKRLHDSGTEVFITAASGEININVNRSGKITVNTKL